MTPRAQFVRIGNQFIARDQIGYVEIALFEPPLARLTVVVFFLEAKFREDAYLKILLSLPPQACALSLDDIQRNFFNQFNGYAGYVEPATWSAA